MGADFRARAFLLPLEDSAPDRDETRLGGVWDEEAELDSAILG